MNVHSSSVSMACFPSFYFCLNLFLKGIFSYLLGENTMFKFLDHKVIVLFFSSHCLDLPIQIGLLLHQLLILEVDFCSYANATDNYALVRNL